MQTFEDLDREMQRLFRYVSADKALEDRGVDGDSVNGVTARRFRLYTDHHAYSIRAQVPTTADERGYLGCTVSRRKPRAGEDWTRGSDLADGPFSMQTWTRILSDIIGYELVPLDRRPAGVIASASVPDQPTIQ